RSRLASRVRGTSCTPRQPSQPLQHLHHRPRVPHLSGRSQAFGLSLTPLKIGGCSMRRSVLAGLAALIPVALPAQANTGGPPATPVRVVNDTIFGTVVPDPY